MPTGDELVRALAAGGRDLDPYLLYADLHRLGDVLALTAPEPPYSAAVVGYEAVDSFLRDASFQVHDAFCSARPVRTDQLILRGYESLPVTVAGGAPR